MKMKRKGRGGGACALYYINCHLSEPSESSASSSITSALGGGAASSSSSSSVPLETELFCSSPSLRISALSLSSQISSYFCPRGATSLEFSLSLCRGIGLSHSRLKWMRSDFRFLPKSDTLRLMRKRWCSGSSLSRLASSSSSTMGSLLKLEDRMRSLVLLVTSSTCSDILLNCSCSLWWFSNCVFTKQGLN